MRKLRRHCSVFGAQFSVFGAQALENNSFYGGVSTAFQLGDTHALTMNTYTYTYTYSRTISTGDLLKYLCIFLPYTSFTLGMGCIYKYINI